MKKVLKRSDYLTLINDIIDTPHNTIDERMQLIEDEYLKDNQHLYDNLYKDIDYIISKYDRKGDGELVIENGDFAIERGDLKVTGTRTNLHGASIWCWMKIIEQKMQSITTPNSFINKMEVYEKDFLHYDEYSPDYKEELNKIVDKLKRHRAGKKTRKKITDIPLWLKITLAVISASGAIIGIVFKPEIKSILAYIKNILE